MPKRLHSRGATPHPRPRKIALLCFLSPPVSLLTGPSEPVSKLHFSFARRTRKYATSCRYISLKASNFFRLDGWNRVLIHNTPYKAIHGKRKILNPHSKARTKIRTQACYVDPKTTAFTRRLIADATRVAITVAISPFHLTSRASRFGVSADNNAAVATASSVQ